MDPDPNSLEMLDPYPDSMNPDPQLRFWANFKGIFWDLMSCGDVIISAY
jgi:hypothetical protein